MDIHKNNVREMVLSWVCRDNFEPIKATRLAQQLGIRKADLEDFKALIKKMIKDGELGYAYDHKIVPGGQPNAYSGSDSYRGDGRDGEYGRDGDGRSGGYGQSGEYGQSGDYGRDGAANRSSGGSMYPSDARSGVYPISARSSNPAYKSTNRTVVGTYYRKNDSFGYVRQQGMDSSQENEIIVRPEDASDAANKDTVRVVVDKKINRKGQRTGAIIEVVDRYTRRYVGTYKLLNGSSYVVVDGNEFTNPIWIGDAQSRKIEPDTKVVIEIIRFPQGMRQGEGIISEVLGPRGTVEADTLSIIRRFELPDKFSPLAMDCVKAATNRYTDRIPEGREDLTRQNIITIDPEDAQDYDDAISVEKRTEGSWILGVHIADVSFFVDEKSPLDDEARRRGNSVYLPDRVIPMLPEQICNGLASLQPGRNRFCKSVFMEFTPDGICCNVRAANTVIQSKARLTYEQVDDFWTKGTTSGLTVETQTLLNNARDLAKLLRRRRREQGYLQMNLPEVKVVYNNKGVITGVRKEVNTESHQMIEEYMVRTNEAVANYLKDQGEAFIRRIHLPPSPQKLEKLEKFVEALGVRSLVSRLPQTNPSDTQTVYSTECTNGYPESGFNQRDDSRNYDKRDYDKRDFDKRDSRYRNDSRYNSGRDSRYSDDYSRSDGNRRRGTGNAEIDKQRFRIQQILDSTAGTIFEFPVHQAALRTMQKAEYSPSAEGHYALASACYCHFTSPIRRYADLTIHRQLQAILTGGRPYRDYEQMILLGQHLSDCEQRSEQAERELTKLKIASFMETKVGQEMTAVITGAAKYGIFVQGVDFPVEAMIPLERLPQDSYQYEEDLQALVGYRQENCFRLGDKLQVRLRAVRYLDEGPQIEFDLVRVIERVIPVGDYSYQVRGKSRSGYSRRSNASSDADGGRFDWSRYVEAVRGKKAKGKSDHKKEKRGKGGKKHKKNR